MDPITRIYFWLLRRTYKPSYNVRQRALEELAEAAAFINDLKL